MPTSLGRVQPIFKGAYDSATTYKKLDNVFYNGDTWVCQIDNTVNVTPSAESNAWQMVASKGGSGGFGAPSGSAEMLPQGFNPTINITASGPDTEKIFNFQFGIPAGADGTQTYLSSVAPTSSGGYNYFPVTALLSPSGITGGSPRQGDLVFYHNSYYQAAGITDPILGARCGQAYTLVISAASDQQVQDAVDEYLEEHPEATTTVEDGSITKAKLVAALSSEITQNTEDVADLRSAFENAVVSTELKLTLLNLAKKVIWTDGRGERYYQDLWNALYGDDYMENFTRVGNPTIEGGIMTASATSWIETPESFDPGSSPWELTIKLYRPSRLTNYEGICSSGGVVLRTPWDSNAVTIDLYSDGGTIVTGASQKSVPAGSWKWLRVVFGGTAATGYDYGISSDGVTYTYIGGGNEPFTGYRSGNYKTATPIKAGVLAIGHAGSYNSIAKYDLREINIKVNGEVVWTPYTLG